MSPPDPFDADDDLELTAAEYVLGLLDEKARATASARLAREPAFLAAVTRWEQRFAPLIDTIAPVTPPSDLWDRIAAAIAPGANVVAFPARPRFWNRARPWRALALASLAAAAACLAIILDRPAAPPAPAAPSGEEVLAATLAAPDGRALYVATLDRSRHILAVVPVARVERTGRSPELWVIAPGGKPRAIGVLVASGAARLAIGSPALRDAGATAVLAVSLEPVGGSLTGAPTGPVIASGPLVRL